MELTKPKKYSELSAQRQIQADCDTKATISFSSKDYQPGTSLTLTWEREWETNVFTAGTTRTYTPRSKGAILGNKGTSYMIQLQREGHMFPNSALNLNGNGNNLGLKDKVCGYSHGGEIQTGYKEGKAVDPSQYHGTVNRGLWYPKDSSIALIAFADADHAGCQDTRRSTSGSMQFLGDRLVSWSSKRQKSAAISSTKAEYIAMSKHIDIRFHFIKEHVENGVIKLYFVNTEYQLADIFTKALARERIEFLINKLGMRSFTPEILKQLADEVDE
ncbi:hypothetical protein Tco_1466153 [Tanacetum coccineum]